MLRRSFRRFCVHGAPVPELCESLSKPFFTPPSWLFGPAWKALYLVMAPAGWLVRRAGSKSTIALPLALFGGQLALNALWSVLVFGLRSPEAALAEILDLSLLAQLQLPVCPLVTQTAARSTII